MNDHEKARETVRLILHEFRCGGRDADAEAIELLTGDASVEARLGRWELHGLDAESPVIRWVEFWAVTNGMVSAALWEMDMKRVPKCILGGDGRTKTEALCAALDKAEAAERGVDV